MRLLWLHLQSRRAGWALACIVASAIISWQLLWQVGESSPTLRLGAIILPLLPAVVIGASAWSPFGEPEVVAGSSLPRLRTGHLGGLLLVSALALAAASSGAGGVDTSLAFARNLAGYGGLALIGARLLGGGIGWVLPLSYASLTLVFDERSRLGWPARIPIDSWSLAVAAILLLAGFGLATLLGARITAAEGD